MSQNLISLNLTEADYAEIDKAINTLETKWAGLIDLSSSERRSLTKMGEKSELFCRQTMNVLIQNPQLIPPSLDLTEAKSDLSNLEALRPRIARLRQLLGRADDSEMALGSDLMNASLEGYALLKVLGKGSGLEALRKDMAARFSRSGPSTSKSETPAS